ncbi:ECSIT protein [Trinorchestia longiramus]|nr:ECSIT protein [Trinorchestia longiramus]
MAMWVLVVLRLRCGLSTTALVLLLLLLSIALRVMRFLVPWLLLALTAGQVLGKIFDKCELAFLLEMKHDMPRSDVKHWVCTAEFESTFNTEAVNKFNWDGSRDYGLFQLSDKFWCDGHVGKNVCKVPCTAFLDDDLTDDLACIRRIIKDTEAWKGKGTGMTAWVAYVNRCQPLNLDEYIAECYNGSYPIPPEIIGTSPEDNLVPRLPDKSASVISQTPATTSESITPSSSSPSSTSAAPQSSTTPSWFVTPTPTSHAPPNTDQNNEIINSARVPYPSHHELVLPGGLARRGAIAVHVSAAKLPFFSNPSPPRNDEHKALGKSIYSVIQNMNPVNTFPGPRWLHTSPPGWVKFKKGPKLHNPEEEKRLIQAGYFQSEEHNKKNFLITIDVYKEKEKLLKGHVQFIQTALNYMEQFGVHQDLEVYKKLMDVFPKVKMIPQNMWQIEFEHYPVQQDCGVDVLYRMEHFGVIPDSEMEDIILTVFGSNSHPMKKCRRMRYWMLKFNNASPWPLPKPVPSELLELAKLAVARMCSVDQTSEVTIYDTKEVKEAIDHTWVVSGQSVHQRQLLNKQPENVPLKVEGPWKIYLRDQSIDYFVLKADPLPQPDVEVPDKDDVSLLSTLLNPDCSLKPDTFLTVQPSVHEQGDGTVLAICVSGTSSRDSLLSWIRLLSHTNPRLEEGLPVVFLQASPTHSDDLVVAGHTYQDSKKEIEQGASGQEHGGGNRNSGGGEESASGSSQDTGGSSQESGGGSGR